MTSRTNPRLRAAAALRDRGEREARGLTLVDGSREVSRALAAGATLVEAFVCEPLLRTADARSAVGALLDAGVPRVSVSRAAFDRVAFGERSDGIVAVARIPSTGLDEVAAGLPDDPLVVVLEAVEKPGNLGAVLRSADGAGANAVIAASPQTDIWNPNAIRASLGTIFALPLASAPSGEVATWLRARGIAIVAARVDGGIAYDTVDLTGPCAIVLGSEAHGLSDAWLGEDVTAVRLPMLGVADSLNVSTAAAVLLYESRRQRDARG
ncbi:MAG TPA: RNA methyltransferase [Candidatus Limnocylindrales bacterium]|nr:RNA methyltransferase [Candidatus Limnocylindrales bacterium]